MTTIISQENTNGALTAIFSSKARVAVLRVFMLDPSRGLYQRQIEAATGLPIRAVQRELERLTETGLLYRWVDGNRTYYQVNTEFDLYPELRAIFLKKASPEECLRGHLAVHGTVRLSLLCEAERRALVVTEDGFIPELETPGAFDLEWMDEQTFSSTLEKTPEKLESYLRHGIDLLGRRDDLLWRRIEAAGYTVERGKGVP